PRATAGVGCACGRARAPPGVPGAGGQPRRWAMHLQIKSNVTAAGGSSGEGITVARPGRLLALLDLPTGDASDGPALDLTPPGGSAIETTGVFFFSVATTEDTDWEDHKRALDRISTAFPKSWIEEFQEADVPDVKGALREFLQGFADQGLLINELAIGVAD